MAKYASILQQSRILILGGSSGMGYSVAEHALTQGATVTISSSRQSKVETAVQRLRESVPDSAANITGQVCDLSNLDTLEHNLTTLLGSITQPGALLDHIVFTAGDAISIKPVQEVGLDRLKTMGNVRFFGPMVLGGLVPKYMTSSAKSSVTLTSGANVTRPGPGWTGVAAWGGGLEGLARGLAVDLAPIRVNVVSPGAVHTSMFDEIPEDRLGSVLDMYKKMSLTGTVGTPEELSEAYMYLMRCSFVTGTLLAVDGGKLAKP